VRTGCTCVLVSVSGVVLCVQVAMLVVCFLQLSARVDAFTTFDVEPCFCQRVMLCIMEGNALHQPTGEHLVA